MQLDQVNSDLKAFNQALAGNGAGTTASGQSISPTLATPLPAQGKATQLIIPTDKTVAAAQDAALPVVKKVVGIHSCVNTLDGLRLLNFHAVPGVSIYGDYYFWAVPTQNMRYHNKSKCLAVQALDQWVMPALNALEFRAIYFAEDSGETVSFKILLKKVDDGSWKLAELTRL